MFQDYCLSHGRPCAAGSLYCSEECKEQDLQECLDLYNDQPIETKEYYYDYQFEYEDDYDDCLHSPTSVVENPFDEPELNYTLRSSSVSSMDSPFLYECDFCKLNHAPSISCEHANSNYTYTSKYPQSSPVSINNNVIESYLKNGQDAYQESIKSNHELILANYRKWLVNNTPN